MKKLIAFLSIIVIGLQGFAQFFESNKQVFKSPQLDLVIAKTKTVAILPFSAKISYKKMPKGMTLESIKEEEKTLSQQMQQGMYTYLLRKSDDYSVSFQDVSRTNALLKKNGIYDNLSDILEDSLCKVLQVDAIIKSTWNYEKTGSEAGAIASALLLGMSKAVATGSIVLQINEKDKGEMVWRFYKEMNEGAFSNANEVMERMMRKIGRNFPFEK